MRLTHYRLELNISESIHPDIDRNEGVLTSLAVADILAGMVAEEFRLSTDLLAAILSVTALARTMAELSACMKSRSILALLSSTVLRKLLTRTEAFVHKPPHNGQAEDGMACWRTSFFHKRKSFQSDRGTEDTQHRQNDIGGQPLDAHKLDVVYTLTCSTVVEFHKAEVVAEQLCHNCS